MMRHRLAAAALCAGFAAAAAPLSGQDAGTTTPPDAVPEASAAEASAVEESAPEESAAARWQRIQAEADARREAARVAREAWEDDVREAEDARLRFEASQREHQAEVARLEAERAEYERRRAEYERTMAEREGGRSARERRPESAGTTSRRETASAENSDCEDQSRRTRRRGRALGALIGAGAGLLGRQPSNAAELIAASLPIGAVIGEAIATLLDRCEQQQAAAATEEAIRGGVGTTVSWESESRPGVTGSSMVTAQETGTDGECLTVTDIVIVDGEETRAPKRMCRRPPSNRYVRV